MPRTLMSEKQFIECVKREHSCELDYLDRYTCPCDIVGVMVCPQCGDVLSVAVQADVDPCEHVWELLEPEGATDE